MRFKVRKKRVLTWLIGTLMLLTGIQCLTYWAWAEKTMPQSCFQSLGYVPPGHYDYIVIDDHSEKQMSPAQRTVLSAFLQQRTPTVYHGMASVPNDRLVTEPITEEFLQEFAIWESRKTTTPETLDYFRQEIQLGRRVIGERGGTRIFWTRESSGLFWMNASAGCHTGPLSAVSSSDTYIWVLGIWIRIKNNGGMIS